MPFEQTFKIMGPENVTCTLYEGLHGYNDLVFVRGRQSIGSHHDITRWAKPN